MELYVLHYKNGKKSKKKIDAMYTAFKIIFYMLDKIKHQSNDINEQ